MGMGDGESNFEGGMSEMQGGSLADQRRRLVQLQNQNAPERGGNIISRIRGRMDSRQNTAREEIKKKEIDQIKKRLARKATQSIVRGCLAWGCIPLLIIFACVGFLGVVWGISTETKFGQIVSNVYSWFNDDFAEIKKEMQKYGPPAPPPAITPPVDGGAAL